MASLPSVDTKNPDYINWVKAGLVLGQLKDGLQEFLDREIEQVHADVVTRIKRQLPPKSSLTCTSCTIKQLQKSAYKRNDHTCNLMFTEVKRLHQFSDPKWKNANFALWCTSGHHWEFAKCFLPDGYDKRKTSADMDCTGLLTLVINCRALHTKMAVDLNNPSNIFTQVRTRRNFVMHSPSLCLSGGELAQLVKDSLAILNDSTSLKLDPAAQIAAGNVAKIEADTLDISLKDQLSVLEETKKAVEDLRAMAEIRSDLEEQIQSQKEDIETRLTEQQATIDRNRQEHEVALALQQAETEQIEQETERQLGMLDSVIVSIGRKTEALTTDVEGLQQEAEIRREEVTLLTRGAGDMRTDIQGLQQETVILGQRVTSLERHRSNLQFNSSDEEELKLELVNKFTELLTTVSVSRWNKKLKIEDIFTPIIIREDLEKHLSEARLQDKKLQYRALQEEVKPITSYDEVFLKERVMQSDIYVIGKAGIGKSLFTLQLVNLWLKVQTNEPTTDIEILLKKFDFVFYVSCRYAKKPKGSEDWDSLRDLILKQNCLGNKRLEDITKQVLEAGVRSCLVLTDGLDEWAASASEKSSPLSRPGIPDRDGLNNCVFLTTSRPWRIEALPDGVGKSCRVLEIVGLDRSGVKKLTRNLLKALNEPNLDRAVKTFLQQVDELKMGELVKVPLMLTNVVVSWHDSGHELDASMCLNYSGMMESLINRSGRTVDPTFTLDQHVNTIPSAFANRKLCSQYWWLIHKLSNLAFSSLFSREKEKSLVFSKQDLVARFGETDLEECLKIGILSQSEAVSESVTCMVTVSFLHKSVQEFLAAVYMCGEEFEGSFQTFRDHCKTAADVFDFQLIITFLCGLVPDKGSLVCRHILTVVDADEVVIQYREHSEHERWYSRLHVPQSVIVHLQEMLVECIGEAIQNPQFTATDSGAQNADGGGQAAGDKPRKAAKKRKNIFVRFINFIRRKKQRCNNDDQRDEEAEIDIPDLWKLIASVFIIPDVFIDDDVADEEYLFFQAKANASHMKSLVFTDELETPEYVFDSVKDMQFLERLQITTSQDLAATYMASICQTVPSLKHLKSLGFHAEGDRYLRVPQDLIAGLIAIFNTASSRTALYLSGLYIDSETLADGSDGKQNRKPPRPVDSMFPVTLTSLAVLDLRVIKMTHQHIQDLCSCLTTSVFLHKLVLWSMSCSDCPRGGCHYDLDISGLTQLKRLYLAFLDISSVRVGSEQFEEVSLLNLHSPGVTASVLPCLPRSQNLWKFNVYQLHEKADVSILVDTLQQLQHVTEIQLHDVDFGDLVLETAHMLRLTSLDLERVSMTAPAWKRCVQSLPNQEVDVNVLKCNIDTETQDEIRSSPRYRVLRWPQTDTPNTNAVTRFRTVPQYIDSVGN